MESNIKSLSPEDQFNNIITALEKQGVKIIYLADNSTDNPKYNAQRNEVFIHKGDLENLYEEAFHVNQFKVLREMGFCDENNKISILTACAAEIEIICRNIERLLKSKEDRSQDISSEESRLLTYTKKLHEGLEVINKSDFMRYKELFKHSSFKRAKLIMEQVEAGITSADIYG
jgi:adenylate cyclase